MKKRIYAVIDTNVLVSALFSLYGNSNTAKIIRSVIDGTLIPLYNDEIIEEYYDVLSREKFNFNKTDIAFLIEVFVKYGIQSHRNSCDRNLFTDKDDIVFYEIALSKKGAYLITGNLKHFPKEPFVVTPTEMISIIEAVDSVKNILLNDDGLY